MKSPKLFSPIRLGGYDLPNRILVSPMCQYSASEGRATDWHLVHYGALANSGAGMLVVEAAAVEARGRQAISASIPMHASRLLAGSSRTAAATVPPLSGSSSPMPAAKAQPRFRGAAEGRSARRKAAGKRSRRPRCRSTVTGPRRAQ
jgi:NADH:flavin oxidoreductase / NADH oxidase family